MDLSSESQLPPALRLTEFEVKAMLTVQMHIGSKNIERRMKPYVWARRPDGLHVFDISKTWEKIVLAARVLACIKDPEDICVVSSRPYAQRAALKFAQYIGAQAFAGRFTPGTFTNHITRTFREPRVIIVSDPRADAQALKEASYVGVSSIAFADTNSPLKYVDIAIPTNNKGKQAIAFSFWLLAREILRLKNINYRIHEWDVMYDLFVYREPEEQDAQEKLLQERNNNQQAQQQEEQKPAQPTHDAKWGVQVVGDAIPTTPIQEGVAPQVIESTAA